MFKGETGRLHNAISRNASPYPQEIGTGNRVQSVTVHESGYLNRDIRMAFFGAHPDDTALDEGVMPLLINASKATTREPYQVRKQAGLFVVTATAGEAHKHPLLSPREVGHKRIYQDSKGTAIYEADGVANNRFTDGNLIGEEEALTESTANYLQVLDPHIVFVPHWDHEVEHSDHVVMQRAVKTALRRNGQSPLVVHTDTQTGTGNVNPTSVLEIPSYIRNVYLDHFLAHETESVDLVDPTDRANFDTVVNRMNEHGVTYGFPHAAVLEQDFSGDFSDERIEDFFAKQGVIDIFELEPVR